MASLDKEFLDACRYFSTKVANSVNTLKRSATVASMPARKAPKGKLNHQRRRSSFLALIPPTFTHHPQATTPTNANADISDTVSLTNSDASIHEGGDFTTHGVVQVRGVKFVEVKRKGGKLESVEMPQPTAKELELYRELETVKKELKIAETALAKKEISRKALPAEDVSSSSNTLAVQYPVRSDSQAWKMNIAKLEILSVYAPRPTIVAQENTIRKLNEAGVFLVPYEEEAEEDTESSLIE